MCAARRSCTLEQSDPSFLGAKMTHLLLHSLVTIQLLSATPEETRFLEAITKDDVTAVRSLLKEDPSLARRAKSARGSSALMVAAYVMTDSEYFYPPAKNEILQEVMRVAPPTDVFEACLVGDLPRAAAFLDKEPNAIRGDKLGWRSEEHTSELQSRSDIVCRLLL